MDPGRPKQLTGAGGSPGQPALETVVRAHSDQLGKQNMELSSAFAQVTGEMGDLRTLVTATSTALTSLSSQVSALMDLVTHPARGYQPDAPCRTIHGSSFSGGPHPSFSQTPGGS